MDSYKKFLQEDTALESRNDERRDDVGLHAAFRAYSRSSSYSGQRRPRIRQLRLGEPVFDVKECQLRGLTYAAPLRVHVRLVIYDKEVSGPNLRREVEREPIGGCYHDPVVG